MDPIDLELVIDSRARDVRAYPSPSHYCVDLDTEVRDVCSMSLAGLAVPDATPTLPSANTVFKAGLGPSPADTAGINAAATTINLTSGSYASGSELAVELGASLARDMGGDIAVTADTEGRLRLESATGPFFITFPAPGGSLSSYTGPARLLGFEPGGTYSAGAATSGTAWAIDAPFCVDMRAFKRYLVIDIWHPQAEVLVSPSATVHRAFAIVKYPHSHKFPHSHISTEGVTSTTKVWSPPLPSLRRIGVSVRTADGTLADFQNQDHVLELKIRRTPITGRFTV
jgi:hypothetical protein